MTNADEFYFSILHNVREEAKKEELDRIIELLEKRIIPSGNPDVHSLDSLHNLMLNNLIALIKGENK